MRRFLTMPALAALVVLAGCTRGAQPTDPYRIEPTQACLEHEGLRVADAPRTDFVASTASGGALRVRFTDIRVTLTFGEDEAEATRIEQAYRRFAPQKLPIEDVLKRDRNVVELWEFSPTIDNQEALNGCLKT